MKNISKNILVIILAIIIVVGIFIYYKLSSDSQFYIDKGYHHLPRYSEPIPADSATLMIDRYNSRPIWFLNPKSFQINADSLEHYIQYCKNHGGIKDIQIIFARKISADQSEDGKLTFIIAGIDDNGHHISFPDPNNQNKPSFLEHCLPCPPPGTPPNENCNNVNF